MTPVWLSVIISFFTSLAVSIVTFILGLRAGKNQTDRPKLKEIYRDLAVHFEDLFNCLSTGTPKRWEDFPKNEKKQVHIPLVKQMKMNGALIEINNELSEKLENIEEQYLFFSFKFYNVLFDIRKNATEFLKKYAYNIEETEYTISSQSSQKGNKLFEKKFGAILVREELDKINNSLDNDDLLGVCFYMNRYHKNYRYCVHANSLKKIKPSTFLIELHNYLTKLPDVIKIMEGRGKTIDNIKKILPILKTRTIDPHPFWQTLKTSILDIFKN